MLAPKKPSTTRRARPTGQPRRMDQFEHLPPKKFLMSGVRNGDQMPTKNH